MYHPFARRAEEFYLLTPSGTLSEAPVGVGLGLTPVTAEGVFAADACGRIQTFLSRVASPGGTGGQLRVCGHHVAHSLEFLRELFRNAELEIPAALGHEGVLCTASLLSAEILRGNIPAKCGDLDSAARHFKIPISSGNRTSLLDAKLAFAVLSNLL